MVPMQLCATHFLSSYVCLSFSQMLKIKSKGHRPGVWPPGIHILGRQRVSKANEFVAQCQVVISPMKRWQRMKAVLVQLQRSKNLWKRPQGLDRTRFCSVISSSIFQPTVIWPMEFESSISYCLVPKILLHCWTSPLLLNCSSKDAARCSALYSRWDHQLTVTSH